MAFEPDRLKPRPVPRLGAIALGSLLAIGALCLSPRSASGQKPKYYFSLQGVKASVKVSPAAKQRADQLFASEIAKHPEVTTNLGDPAPEGEELLKALKARGLKGYGLVMRITKNEHQIHPPAPGKVYRVLMVEVAVAIDAEKLPSSQLALAGEGSAQVGTEISKFKEKERRQLMFEALAEATKQAVDRTVKRLSEQKKQKKQKKQKRSRTRRKGKGRR